MPETSVAARCVSLATPAITLTAVCATAAFAQSIAPSPAGLGQVQTASFRAGRSSSGWIDFTPHANFGIYVPVKINGHEAMALLYGGPSSIEKNFTALIGGETEADAAGSVSGVEVQVGDLTFQHASAKPDNLQAQGYDAKILGHPVLFRLGEEVFDQVVVDVDYPHHRVAFRDPKTVTKPAGAIEVPLVELDSERVVPLSVDGGPPAQFELELGNVIGPLLVTPSFARTQKLFDGHPTSQRLSGRFTETVVSVDHLGFAGADFPRVPIALIPETELPPASITGGVGLPLLAKFRLIIDYSHDRLYAIPSATAIKAPIEKDRIGLVLDKKDTSGFSVAFVSPNSPAEAAGFAKGDKIALIDGRPFSAWSTEAIIRFQMADAGSTHTFTMPDGAVRQVKAADFF
jgi:hypothetical protein